MVTYIRELSEDEKIRQQCQAREDYERRLIGEYNRGGRVMLYNLVKEGTVTARQAAEKLDISEQEFIRLMNMQN